MQQPPSDPAAEEQAINRLIEADPHSVPAHIAKARCRARAGDDDLATYFYRAALRLAETAKLSAEERAELAAAQAALRDIETRTDSARKARLAERGLPPERWSERFRQSVDLAAGRTRLYLQEPTAFTYPGLPHVQYYDPASFPWAAGIEAATATIRDELLAVLREGDDAFRPYVRSDVGSIPLEDNRALLNNKDWSVLSLCELGWVMPDMIRRCPRSWEAVLQAPVPRVSGWGPTVVFSMLKAGAHIAPHTGMFNTRLICHLPLIVPPGCRFRVGNEVREWQVGKLMIFDDTIEHEAWNDSAEDRVVLIFDVWRPELSEQERFELTALFSD
ncbi:MAG TPA: aspartyl/asparaginyl beta-hydroxylase domain-containing protein [Allosphingosinicella sp.]|jgi:aspartyl/asparaginyl beta-hydroxylase (cupin superfamily)